MRYLLTMIGSQQIAALWYKPFVVAVLRHVFVLFFSNFRCVSMNLAYLWERENALHSLPV